MMKKAMMIVGLCFIMMAGFRADAAKIRSLTIKTMYRDWLSSHTDYYYAENGYYRGRLVFVDINDDGTVDGLYSERPGKQIVLSYDKKKNKLRTVINKQMGHTGSLLYNKKKHMVCVSGDMEHEQKVYFYKISGFKAKKKKEMKYYSVDIPKGKTYTRKYVYQINSKKVSLSTYNKDLIKTKKGYKSVTVQ